MARKTKSSPSSKPASSQVISTVSVPADTIRSIAERALRPRRSGLARCLVQITGVSERVCARIAAEDPTDALRVAVLEHAAPQRENWQGSVSPVEAWEALVPEAWVGAAERRFETLAGTHASSPDTFRAVATFASDLDGMLTAEAAAREALARMAPIWEPAQSVPPKFVWRMTEIDDLHLPFSSFVELEDELEEVGEEHLAPMDALFAASLAHHHAQWRGSEGDEHAIVLKICAGRLGASAWDLARALQYDLVLSSLTQSHAFAPLVRVWESGYAIDSMDARGIVLVAPAA